MAKTTFGTAHRHKDSRGKWVTDELPHTHDLPAPVIERAEFDMLRARMEDLEATPAFNFTADQVTKLLALIGGGGGTPIPTPNPPPDPDLTAPVISSILVGPATTTSCPVSWATDEPATGQVEYGPVPVFGSATTLDASLTLTKSQTLTGLTPSTPYQLKVHAKDAATNAAVSAVRTFTTAAAPSVPPTANPFSFTTA